MLDGSSRADDGLGRVRTSRSGPSGSSGRAVRRTPEAYQLTSWTALELARPRSAGELLAGFQTPARA